MRIALGITKLFPEGGLQRDCIRLARILVARGHDVTIFTSETRVPLNMLACPVVLLPVRSYTNHGTDLKFAKRFATATAASFDRVIGFNKLIGLDLYYCADPSVLERGRNFLERSLPRHRGQLMLEQESFGPLQHTHILALTDTAAKSYRRFWATQSQRITVLRPSIDPVRQCPDLRTAAQRAAIRSDLGIANHQRVWLWVGSHAHTKGLDRVLMALQNEPDAILLVVGIAHDSKEGTEIRHAKLHRQILKNVQFLGFREDIPKLMAAADVLVHPSRRDVTGQVILEAVVNGLPAVVTSVCGFAEHVEAAGAGIVLPGPFSKTDLDDALRRLRDPALARQMSDAGIRYGSTTNLVSGLDQAADVVELGAYDRNKAPALVPNAQGRRAIPHPHVPVSVIVTTYNQTDALATVLRGLARQSNNDFEVIIADDGSTSDTADLLRYWQTRLRQPLIHVWHEDRGFRAAEIRNQAILVSTGAYCIFLDGDCIPRDNFIDVHRHLAEIGWFVVGNRVLMSEQLTKEVLNNRLEPERWSFGQAVHARLSGRINRIAPLVPARLGPGRKLRSQQWHGARSCNLAVWRSDLDRVDGFDNSYVGWGLEDSDLVIRLLRAGVRRKDGQFSTGVFHLWHSLADTQLLSASAELLDAIKQTDRIQALRGLSALQGAAGAGDRGYVGARQIA